MAAPPPEGSMRLKVLRMGGTSYDVVVPRTATCEDLKRQLVNLASLPVDRQRLIFRGRVLQNESRLSDAGVTNDCTLHLVDSPAGAAQQPPQQGAAAGAAAGAGAGANWAEMLGGLFGAPPGAAAGGVGPGGVQGTVLGPFVVNAGGAGGGGDFGTAIAQQIAAALGGVGLQPPPMPPQPGQGVPPPPRPTTFLRMPTLPALRPPGAVPAALPHLLTGLNLMTSRMEHEYDEPELDPLPRIREYYGRPGGPEVMHFLRSARTLLNSAQLLRPTRDAIDSVLESAGLPTLRPAPWQHEGDESGDESEDESGDEPAGGQGRRQAGARGGRSSAASQGPAVRSFPVSADNSDAEPDEDGAVPWQPARARSGASSASGAAPATAAAASARRGVAAARGGDSPPPLETDSDSDSPRQQRGRLGRRGGRDSDAESLPGLTEDDSEDDYTDEDDDVGGAVPTESLILVAAVCLGELTARFLDVAGANSDDALWDLADELRALTRVQRQDYAALAETVQQLTVRMYRLGSVWAELSRGMQYLGAALETGNMAIVNAIPGYLMVQGSQASPNLLRPGFPPMAYHQPVNGYFGGQIPDTGVASVGAVPLGAVVDITVGSTGPVMGAPAGGVPAQQPGQAQQPQQQQGGAQQGQQPPAAVGVTLQQMLGNLPGILGRAAAGVAAGQLAGQQAAGQQPAGQQLAGRPELSSTLGFASQALSLNRSSIEQVAQRVQEARNAMQALITGREGGPQQVLQRAHTTMQALVSAEEILRRARERAEHAAQQVQRMARTEQQNQQLRDQLQRDLRDSNQRHLQLRQEQEVLARSVREMMARHGTAGVAAAAPGQPPQQGAAGAQGAGGAAAFAAVAQQLMAGLGLSPGQQQNMLAEIEGAAQALQQASLSALDVPALLEDVRTSLGTAVRDVVRQVRAADIPSAATGAAAGEAAAGAAASGQDEVAVLAEAAVPTLVAAVQGVLSRHVSRLMQAPQLQQYMPHLRDLGIDLQPLATGAANGAAPTEAAAPTSAAPAAAAALAATAPAVPAAPAAPTTSAAPAAVAAAAAPPAPPVSAPAPSPALQAASAAAPPSSAAPAAEAAAAQAAVVMDAPPSRAHAPSQAADAGPSSGSQQATKPAGLGLGKGLGRPAIKKRPAGLAAKPAASSTEAGMQAAAAMAALAEASTAKPQDAATASQAAPKAAASQPEPAAPAAPPAAPEEAAGSAPAEPATQPALSESSQAPQPTTATAAASSAGPLVSQQGAAGPRGGAAGGGGLASLMSGLLGGPAGGGGGGSGAGGGGLMDLMGSVMQSPAFMQMAQSPAMQQMADRMLGGGSGGGSLDLGSMMNDMLGALAGPPGQGRQGPRARGMDGVLGGAEEGAAPADLDSVLSVLPEEEAARWKGIIEADTQRQERMLAAEAAGAGADSGFSDAYSALRMAGRRGASSGLLGLLDSRDEEEAEE